MLATRRRRNAGASPNDAAEFTRLYQESYPLVYNYVRRRMACDDAEDVVAEAYLLAARSFSSYDPSRAKFSTWVIHIAINCMNNYYRRSRLTLAIDEIPESVFIEQGEEEEGIANRELVDQLMGVLDLRERELVLLKYGEGMRNVDIAEQLDMNPSTVSTMLARALAKMHEAADGSM